MAQGDAELIERCRQGDQAAYRVLFDRHGRDAFVLARRIVGSEQDAEDVVQEAFLKAFRSLDRFRGGSAFYTWLYRIVYNGAIDRLRKTGRVRTVDYDDAIERREDTDGAADLLPPRQDADPGRVAARRELKEQMEAALERLSDAHRAVLVLREVQGLTYEEIAEVVGCPKGTVMSRLHHARRRMQELLLPYRETGAAVGSEE